MLAKHARQEMLKGGKILVRVCIVAHNCWVMEHAGAPCAQKAKA